MLRDNNIKKYIDYLAQLISCSIYLSSRPEAIEQRLLKSEIIIDLENSDESFLNQPLEHLFMNTFNIEPSIKVFGLFNNLFYWVSEVYIRLFLKYKKSFSYLFLVLPLKKSVEMFELYHQMDFSETYTVFEDLMKRNRILPSLINKNNLTMKKLSELTKINYNTIDYYCRRDENLFSGSYPNLLILSKVLKVDGNIFLKQLNIEI